MPPGTHTWGSKDRTLGTTGVGTMPVNQKAQAPPSCRSQSRGAHSTFQVTQDSMTQGAGWEGGLGSAFTRMRWGKASEEVACGPSGQESR